ncbi:MAG: hypothetical protein H7A45_09580 [Verrucomicrobiales bacterium]|nr:hypothetical protein [Verrucomicrobiales bacterium]MCP5526259.1 hypothetical protein [Verrucomicrobiales bacterium]
MRNHPTTHRPAPPTAGPQTGSVSRQATSVAEATAAGHGKLVLREAGTLGIPAGAGLILVGAGGFHAGFLIPSVWWLIGVWLGALFSLRRLGTARRAFYAGMTVGLLIYGPELHFFWRLFGPAAAVLWLILAFWSGLFLLGLQQVQQRWGGTAALWLAPVGWMAVEYFRSELYPLRFAWFLTGGCLPLPGFGAWLHFAGVYGSGAMMMFLSAFGVRIVETRGRCLGRLAEGTAAMTLIAALALACWWSGKADATGNTGNAPTTPGVAVAGVQFEFAGLPEIITGLEAVVARHPEAQLILLSEYAVEGQPPARLRRWCRDHERWLVVGGRDPLPSGAFHNTAFVIDPEGEVVFKQAKNVPIQFFDDGLPAPGSKVWHSPWGPIGIAVCYDASYTRVMDRYVRQGARGLLLPAMDVAEWGAHEHRLNSRQTLLRSAEYGIPVFRVASSGISQLTAARHGRLLATAPFPGPGAILAGRLEWKTEAPPSLPWDRVAAPLSVAAAFTVGGLLAVPAFRRRGDRRIPGNDARTGRHAVESP